MQQIKCALTLMEKELVVFVRLLGSKIIDAAILLGASLVVFGYFMRASGLDATYGAFLFTGYIASFGFYEVLARATLLAQEVMDNKIQNYLILPLSTSAFFLNIVSTWSIALVLQTIPLIPIGKLVLQSNLDLSRFISFKFVFFFFLINIFYSALALWFASLMKDLRSISWIGARVITPLLMFSGYYYSWETTYALSPMLGYLQLLNPLLFAVEGVRAAVLQNNSFLNYWICFIVLCLVTSAFAWDAIRRLRRRTDAV